MITKYTDSEKKIGEMLEFFKRCSIFDGLSPESLMKISEKAEEYLYAKDTAIIENGTPGRRLYIIKSGSAKVVKEEGFVEFTVTTLQKGACFGEMSILTGEPCCATVKTCETSALYVITKSDFDEVVSENPHIYKHFIKLLAERINSQNKKNLELREHEIALSRYLQDTKEYRYSCVIGNSLAMKKIMEEAGSLSKIDDPVLITGEPGSGKGLIARNLHRNSARTKHPVVEYVLPRERRDKNETVPMERRKMDCIACELFGSEKVTSYEEIGKRVGRFELADEGTLIIRNIENMPFSIQQGLRDFLVNGVFYKVGGDGPVCANIRIIATTSAPHVAQEKLDTRLYRLLSRHILNIVPLRSRKKEIPELVEYFSHKISKEKHIPLKAFSRNAINKLLQYDYPGNVMELENIAIRAIALSNGNVIEEEEIFLGDIDVGGGYKFNLLKVPFVKRLCESRSVFPVVKNAVFVFFLVTLYLILFQPGLSVGGRSLALVLCWQIALPVLFIVYLLAARLGCGLCPISTIAKFSNKLVSGKVPLPGFLKNHDMLVMGAGFLSILFLEEYTRMEYSAAKTGWLLFGVTAGAVVFEGIFEKSAWCRHLCPLGGLGGLLGASSLLEIRANKDICSAVCATHECHKGSERAGPCPMFLHLRFLQSNRDCKFCLNCVRSCKHNAPQLNLRIPGAEIGALQRPPFAGGFFSVALCGFLAAKIASKQGLHPDDFPLVSALCLFFAIGMGFTANYFTASAVKGRVTEHLSCFGYALLPLALFGYIALKFAELFGDVKGSLVLLNVFAVDVNGTILAQAALMLTGFIITLHTSYLVIQRKIVQGKRLRIFITQGTVPAALATLYISLLFFKEAIHGIF